MDAGLPYFIRAMPKRSTAAGERRAVSGRPRPRPRGGKHTWDRRPNPQRRIDLLWGVVDYCLEHGLSELSLRPVAAKLDTSPRMLLHYFKSKENLIIEALRALGERELGQIFSGAILEGQSMAQFDELVARTWNRYSTDEATLRFMRLFFEAIALAFRNPRRFKGFADAVTAGWYVQTEQALSASGVPPERSRELATAYLAGLRGLVLDLLVTGDRARVDTGFALLTRNFKRDLRA